MRRLAMLLLACAVSPPAWAWGVLGHRMVGTLAERHLSPAAQAQVARLLAGESDPTLAGVATWPDQLRNTDPARFQLTSRWHYLRMPPGSCSYDPARACPDGNCITSAIERQRALLADRSQPPATRREALKFLAHFVGDLHQPLHANNRNDKGGNDFQISLRTDLQPEAYARGNYADGVMGTNMHAVWDYYILGSRGLDVRPYTEILDAMTWPPTYGADAASQPAEAWAGESCRLIDARALYPQRRSMDRAYLDAQRPLAEQRVRQAAYRLAVLLNDALK